MAVPYFKEGHCNLCGQKIGVFRDELSEREHAISKMCQECQDHTFVDYENEDDLEDYERNQLALDGND